MNDPAPELDLTIITITVDTDWNIDLQSDVNDMETVWILEKAKLMVLTQDEETDQ